MPAVYPVFLIIPMAMCLGSFAWGMRRFFVRHGPMSLGLKATTIAGLISALLHGTVIVTSPQPTIAECSTGIALYSVSLLLFWWAEATNRGRPLAACFTPVGPTHITMSGPYRLVRHPFYCAYLLTWLAGLVGTGSLWLLPNMAAMSAIYGIAALKEEKQFSSGPLAVQYREYRSRTGMFFPIFR